MKRKLIGLSRRYVAALQKHLRPGPCASLQPALTLGHQAAALDLETLDVARIHEATLARLKTSSAGDKRIKQEEEFFSQAITPIEKTHRVALTANVCLSHFHVAGEALTNVAHHAQASQVEVSHRKMGGFVCMRISDDGKSFGVEGTLHSKGGKRLGLRGMSERLEMVGGRFEIEWLRTKAPTSRRRFHSARPRAPGDMPPRIRLESNPEPL